MTEKVYSILKTDFSFAVIDINLAQPPV